MDYTQLSDTELQEAVNFHRRQRNMSRSINEAAHMRQTQIVRLLEAEEARRLDEISAEKKMAYGKAAFADYHKQSKAKLGKILSGDKDTSGESRKIANRLKGISTASKTEEVELDEGISNLSDARLKFHVLKDIPHGSYTKKEMAAEHLRRKKAGGPAYNAVKPSLNEESDLEEAKTDVYHKHMLKALGKSRLPKDHPYTSSIANNGDFVVRKGSEIAGRIPKGEHNLKEETMTPTDMKQREKIVKGMKKSAQDFKDRYGSKWKSVMYATATKAAMKEEVEQIDEKITEVSMKQLQKKFSDGTHEAMNDPKPGSHVELRNTKTGKRTTHYVKEEVELDEGKVDKNHPIYKEYLDLKKNDIKTLRNMISGERRIVDTSEFRSKDHAISTILRDRHGNKKVDQAFSVNEEVELDEYAALNNDYSGMSMNRESAGQMQEGAWRHAEMNNTSKKAHADAEEKIKKSSSFTSDTLKDINDKLGNTKKKDNVKEAAKPKPGHNARVMARAQDTIRKSIEKSKKDDDDDKEKVDEAGAFSYGYKKPRKGTVAYNAAEQRKKQEKDEKPIEPKDQKVGNAKITKEGEEFKKRQSVAGLKKMIDDHDARAKTTTSPLKKEHHRKMSQQLRDQLADIKEEVELDEAESWEAGYDRRVVKTTKPEHKEKGYNWRIKGKERPEISIRLYKEKPSQEEFNKQMKRVAGHEFGG